MCFNNRRTLLRVNGVIKDKVFDIPLCKKIKKKGNDTKIVPFLLLDFDFLFHVYFFALRVLELIFEEGETLIGDNLNT